MATEFVRLVELSGRVMEGVGVLVMMLGAAAATWVFFQQQQLGLDKRVRYTTYRQSLGRAILLGLEFLVAGDIIRTVAVEPTFASIGVLAGIVLIRTFLNITLELETEGRWPWSPPRDSAGGPGDPDSPSPPSYGD